MHGIWNLLPKDVPMPTPTLIVIGTSAGGLQALSALLGMLPNDLDAPVCVARHADPSRKSLMPQILSRVGTLTVAPFESGAPLLPGHLFVAPAGHHLLIEHTQVNVLQEWPKHPRDDIDRLFQSAAASYGCRLIAVILTGKLTDGTAGLQSVKHHGGTTIIQDPEEAAFPSMPNSAQARCAIDYCLSLAHIALLLPRLLLDMASH
jgi:two-component system chemotaxis response regulator CheB